MNLPKANLIPMPEKTMIEVQGLKQLERDLINLGNAVAQKKALRNAMTVATKPMITAAKANVPYLTPDTNEFHIRDSIGRSTKFPKGGPTVVTLVGEKKKKFVDKNGKKRVLVYGHLLEFGGHPWLRPAFDANVSAFLTLFKSQLKKNIDKVKKK